MHGFKILSFRRALTPPLRPFPDLTPVPVLLLPLSVRFVPSSSGLVAVVSSSFIRQRSGVVARLALFSRSICARSPCLASSRAHRVPLWTGGGGDEGGLADPFVISGRFRSLRACSPHREWKYGFFGTLKASGYCIQSANQIVPVNALDFFTCRQSAVFLFIVISIAGYLPESKYN